MSDAYTTIVVTCCLVDARCKACWKSTSEKGKWTPVDPTIIVGLVHSSDEVEDDTFS